MSDEGEGLSLHPVAIVLEDFVGRAPGDLSCKKDDLIVVLEQNPGGYEGLWLCSFKGHQGLCPSQKLRIKPRLYQSLYDQEDDFSIRRNLSGFQRSITDQKGAERIRLVSTAEIMCVLILYSLRSGAFWNFLKLITIFEGGSFLFPYLLGYIFLGLPIHYLLLILGQFSQRGPFDLWRMAPVFIGGPYCSLVYTIFDSGFTGHRISDTIFYSFKSLARDTPWLNCSLWSSRSPGCFTLGDPKMHFCMGNEKNCTKSILSSVDYFRKDFLGRANPDEDLFYLGKVKGSRLVSLFFTWSLLYGFITYGFVGIKRVLKIVLLGTYVFMFMIFIASLTKDGSVEAMSEFFNVEPEQLIKYELWQIVITDLTSALCYEKLGIMLIGSYINPSTPSLSYSITLCTIHFFTVLFFNMATLGFIGPLAHRLKVDVMDILENDEAILYGLVTLGATLYSARELWLNGFLLFYLLFCFFHQMLTLDIAVSYIYDVHVNFKKYNLYVNAFICFSGFAIGLISLTKESMDYVAYLHNFLRSVIAVVFITIFMAIFLSVYGVKKICDDIHFLHGHQPALYWKFCWIIIPTITCMIVAASLLQLSMGAHEYTIAAISVTVLCAFPFVIGVAFKGYKYAKKQQIEKLFKTHTSWGPRNYEERKLRKKFNPSQETRSTKLDQTCEHHCLINSVQLQNVILEEDLKRNALLE